MRRVRTILQMKQRNECEALFNQVDMNGLGRWNDDTFE
jgi:hypothetical protein